VGGATDTDGQTDGEAEETGVLCGHGNVPRKEQSCELRTEPEVFIRMKTCVMRKVIICSGSLFLCTCKFLPTTELCTRLRWDACTFLSIVCFQAQSLLNVPPV
jgi:hypothetical protein